MPTGSRCAVQESFCSASLPPSVSSSKRRILGMASGAAKGRQREQREDCTQTSPANRRQPLHTVYPRGIGAPLGAATEER